MSENKKQNYNTILLMGILMYINDEDMDIFLEQLEHQCMEQTRICIREPIGVGERLTLKDFFSEDLNDNYNAIFQTTFHCKASPTTSTLHLPIVFLPYCCRFHLSLQVHPAYPARQLFHLLVQLFCLRWRLFSFYEQ